MKTNEERRRKALRRKKKRIIWNCMENILYKRKFRDFYQSHPMLCKYAALRRIDK